MSANEILEARNSQHVLKAEGASPDATARENCANASPDGGPMGDGQAAAAAPSGVETVYFRRSPSEPEDGITVPIGTAAQHVAAELITRVEPDSIDRAMRYEAMLRAPLFDAEPQRKPEQLGLEAA